MRRSEWDVIESRKALKQAEAEGRVADSMDVRMALVARFEAGEITLEQMQSELKAIKRNAKKNGLVTSNQAYNGR